MYLEEDSSHWIAQNLLLNYGLWEDYTFFIESFYNQNDIAFNVNMECYAMMIMGISQTYMTYNEPIAPLIKENIYKYSSWKDSLTKLCNQNGFSLDIMVLKIDNSKQLLLLLSKDNENSLMTTYDMATIIFKQQKNNYIFRNTDASKFSCSFSDDHSGYTKLHLAYLQTRKLNDLIFFDIDNQIITQQLIRKNHVRCDEYHFNLFMEKWINLLFSNQKNELIIHTSNILTLIKNSYDINYYNYFKKIFNDNLFLITQVLELKKPIKNSNFFKLNDFKKYVMNMLNYINSNCDTVYSKNIFMSLYYIKENYNDYNLKLNDISDYIGISNSYLSTEFKHQLHISLVKYIHNYRCKIALQQLLNSNLKIKEIATNVGYYNYELFTKYFKQIYKINPSQYRDLHSK